MVQVIDEGQDWDGHAAQLGFGYPNNRWRYKVQIIGPHGELEDADREESVKKFAARAIERLEPFKATHLGKAPEFIAALDWFGDAAEFGASWDFEAGLGELYDWGDRPAEMPAPITRWVDRHSTDE